MKKVAVFFGGISSEHDVSRISVTSVLNNIDRAAYTPVVLGITRDGRWFKYTGDIANIKDGAWEKDMENLFPAILSPDRRTHGIIYNENGCWKEEYIDVIFPVLHGKNGEDGTFQGIAELAGIPYVGCGVMASANCMDKDVAKLLFTSAGIPNAKWITLLRWDERPVEEIDRQIRRELGYPVFVKPANAGSSVGVTKVHGTDELEEALKTAFHEDYKVLVEETIVGKEVECAVMGNTAPRTSDVLGEIEPLRESYDYEGKYLDNSTKLHIPARISDEERDTVKAYAIKAYKALGCEGLSRVDFFVTARGVFLNEINTLPGFTNISMYPKLFMASGMEYKEIITELLELAYSRRGFAAGGSNE